MMKLFFSIFLFLFIAGGCTEQTTGTADPDKEGENEVTDNRAVSYGIYVTAETSPDIIAVWGAPREPGTSQSEDEVNIPEGYSLNVPYPNPGSGNQAINFELPEATSGRIRLEYARWSEENEQDFADPFVAEIANQQFSAGYHSVQLNYNSSCIGGENSILEAGFYRVYFESEEFSFWRDIYITGYEEEAPEGIEQYTDEFCRN